MRKINKWIITIKTWDAKMKCGAKNLFCNETLDSCDVK